MMNPSRSMPTLVALAITLFVATGCETVGYVADVIAGEQNIPAAYEPQERATLVLVEDPLGKLPTPDLAPRIAGRVSDHLTDQQVVSQIIPTTVLNRFITQTPDYHTHPENWPIDKIGRQVGAEQVIYIVVQSFQLSEDNAIYRPVAEVRVKVVDVASGKRLFPTHTTAGYPVVTRQFYRSMEGSSGTTDNIVSRQLADQLAAEVAKLFYEHTPPQPGEGLPN